MFDFGCAMLIDKSCYAPSISIDLRIISGLPSFCLIAKAVILESFSATTIKTQFGLCKTSKSEYDAFSFKLETNAGWVGSALPAFLAFFP